MIATRVVSPDEVSTCRALASQLRASASRAVEAQGRFALALSGGHTPETLFRLLVREFRETIPWSHVEVYWADERAVPPTDPLSNYGLAERLLLAPLKIAPTRIHRIRGELAPPASAADAYDAELKRAPVDGAPREERGPLDLVLLGVGADGHTASVFPGSPAPPPGRWAVATPAAPQAPHVPRITLTLELLARTPEVAFLACGEEKRAILERLGRPEGSDLPAARVRAQRAVTWFLDAAASG